MATYGEGDPTDNAQEFFDWLKETNDSLQGLKYTVLLILIILEASNFPWKPLKCYVIDFHKNTMHLGDVYHHLIHYYWSHYQSECVYCCYIRCLDWVIRRMSIIMRWDAMLIRDWRS